MTQIRTDYNYPSNLCHSCVAVSDVGGPVAAVGEAPDSGGFGGEGGGGELREILPVTRFFMLQPSKL